MTPPPPLRRFNRRRLCRRSYSALGSIQRVFECSFAARPSPQRQSLSGTHLFTPFCQVNSHEISKCCPPRKLFMVTRNFGIFLIKNITRTATRKDIYNPGISPVLCTHFLPLISKFLENLPRLPGLPNGLASLSIPKWVTLENLDQISPLVIRFRSQLETHSIFHIISP